MTHGCASVTKRSQSWTISWAPMRSESLTSKTPGCIRLFAGFKRALPHGWDPTRFTILRCSPRSGGSEASCAQLVKKLGIDVVHQPTPISPRVPSLLVDLPAPLVIGPMNGAMEYPPGFRFLQPRGVRGVKNLARGLANALPRPVDAKRQAECLIVANQRTEDGLPSGVRGRIFRMVENGVVPELWARGLAEGVAESPPQTDLSKSSSLADLNDGRGPSGSSRRWPVPASRWTAGSRSSVISGARGSV